jgi:hypothetical protein
MSTTQKTSHRGTHIAGMMWIAGKKTTIAQSSYKVWHTIYSIGIEQL